ncbi:MAG: hypothetical protein JRD93_20975 [Deltaproteobacteria bacterium]|nr:hypothetical protein [Deltaproteobacteria bacterium]
MIKITATIKTLILEFMAGNGAGHIKEIHLKVTEFKPNVPQHTVRARLSEMSRSDNLEEKLSTFGSGFYGLYNEDKHLCSVVSYPDRGPWGDAGYRGNCSGHLVKDLILRFNCQSVFDPAEGGGTVREVVAGINKHRRQNIYYKGKDLKDGWDILESPLPQGQFDFVWYHPPYWDIIRYSDNPKDLSNAKTLQEFEVKLNQSVKRLFKVVKPGGIIGILIGDKRKNGAYYSLMRTLLMNSSIGRLKAIIIKIQHNCKSDRKFYGSNNTFLIPIKHEYCLIYQKQKFN